MSGESLIERVDASNTHFKRTFLKLKPDIIKEARQAIGLLVLVDVNNPPARLHLHPLTGKTVTSVLDPSKRVKVYTFHLTSNDSWKASFTLENGIAYLRLCGPHDQVDKSP